jgi:hypothetical protein
MAQTLRSDPLPRAHNVSRLGPSKSAENAPKPLLRFPGDGATRLTLTAADRLVVSSAITGGKSAPRRRSVLPAVGFVALCGLAAVGAVSLYNLVVGAFLP